MPTTDKLNARFIQFIHAQPMFFVATAAADGRVNVSPKGLDSLRILDNGRIQWLNLSGSGNETAAHVRSHPRMTLMFCSMDDKPLILRVYGTAKVLHPRDNEWPEALQQFPKMAGSRQIFDLTIELVQTSCGTGVPVMQLSRTRADEELLPFYEEMGEKGVKDYWSRKNMLSIDGTPTGLFDK
ncbi:MAG: pyridoxamine 5'-phosphate oxidase family protein [Granulosicoccaceae bacterium]